MPARRVFACIRSNISNTVRFFRETHRGFYFYGHVNFGVDQRRMSSGPVVVQSRALDIAITVEILRSRSREALGPRVSFAMGNGPPPTSAIPLFLLH